MMIAGVSGGARNGTVALAEKGQLVAVCAQERATRVRGAGVNPSGLPDEALDLLLQRAGRTRAQISRYVMVDGVAAAPGGAAHEQVGHHFAHACTAYLTSPFPSALIVVCDHETPCLTVWKGDGPSIERVDLEWTGAGFADVYSRMARAMGFHGPAADQRLEALARLSPGQRDPAMDRFLTLAADALVVDPALEHHVEQRVGGLGAADVAGRSRLASALQARLGELLLECLGELRSRVGVSRLCVGGSLFYHSSMNTLVKSAPIFDEVFVPIDPGNSGLAVGAVLHGTGRGPRPVSPFLGPSYSSEETKSILDNCKLQYSWESEGEAIDAAVEALRDGRLVGWFDESMEWGPRALGARCILASPTAPYVLENLNHFLKHREPWRGYALSGLHEAVATHFDGPLSAPFMECDYRPRDRERFRHVLPSAEAAVRVHTVAGDALPRFTRLLEVFGEATGLPFLVNTSFNGFSEPIVCNPRDAVRVFYGSGLDLLVMSQFVLRK